MQKVKKGEIDELPEDPKAAFLAQMMKDQSLLELFRETGTAPEIGIGGPASINSMSDVFRLAGITGEDGISMRTDYSGTTLPSGGEANTLPTITGGRSLRENVAINEQRRRRNQEILDAAKSRLPIGIMPLSRNAGIRGSFAEPVTLDGQQFTNQADAIKNDKKISHQRPVTMSSGSGGDRLTDGSFNNFTNTKSGDQRELDWMMVDLGAEHKIKALLITNRTDCCKDRAIGIRAIVLDSNKKAVKSTPAIVIVEDSYEFVFDESKGWSRPGGNET